MAAIITLRQEVLTGVKTSASSLTVKSYRVNETSERVISYELLDGRKGIIPVNNIAGICQLKEN